MKAKSTVRFKIPSPKHLETIFEALKPEITTSPTERSQAVIRKENESLVLMIEASDTAALRAATNAYLRWINSIFNVLRIFDNLT